MICYAFYDNLPTPDTGEGRITYLGEQLRRQLSQKLGNTAEYALSLLCVNRCFDPHHDVLPEMIKRLQNAATIVVMLSQNYLESYQAHALNQELSQFFQTCANSSSLFIVELDRFQQENLPLELCSVQRYSLVNDFSGMSSLYELGCELTGKLYQFSK